MQRFIKKFTNKSLTVNILLSLLVFLGSICYGGTVGKINGQVTDIATGDPLIGANVVLEGTNMGAAHPVSAIPLGTSNPKDKDSKEASQSDIMSEKVTNDAASYAKSLAKSRNRNIQRRDRFITYNQ